MATTTTTTTTTTTYNLSNCHTFSLLYIDNVNSNASINMYIILFRFNSVIFFYCSLCFSESLKLHSIIIY